MTVCQGHMQGLSLLHGVEICASAFTTKEVKGGKCRVTKCSQFHSIEEAPGGHTHANVLEGRRPTPRVSVACLPRSQVVMCINVVRIDVTKDDGCVLPFSFFF